jgi:hypothetical protein
MFARLAFRPRAGDGYLDPIYERRAFIVGCGPNDELQEQGRVRLIRAQYTMNWRSSG